MIVLVFILLLIICALLIAGEYLMGGVKIDVDNSKGNWSIGFIGGLQLLFMCLKLSNVIKWSWIWVLFPLWISFLLLMAMAIIYIVANKRR